MDERLSEAEIKGAARDRVQQDKWKTGGSTVSTRFAYDGQNIWADTDTSNNAIRLMTSGSHSFWVKLSFTIRTPRYVGDICLMGVPRWNAARMSPPDISTDVAWACVQGNPVMDCS